MSIAIPEIRITRITDTYLDDALDEANKEAQGPPKKTRAQKKAARKEAKRLQKVEEQKLVLRVSKQRLSIF